MLRRYFELCHCATLLFLFRFVDALQRWSCSANANVTDDDASQFRQDNILLLFSPFCFHLSGHCLVFFTWIYFVVFYSSPFCPFGMRRHLLVAVVRCFYVSRLLFCIVSYFTSWCVSHEIFDCFPFSFFWNGISTIMKIFFHRLLFWPNSIDSNWRIWKIALRRKDMFVLKIVIERVSAKRSSSVGLWSYWFGQARPTTSTGMVGMSTPFI